MRLNLKDIIHVPGASLPFEFQLDLSHLDFFGTKPLVNPLRVSGIVRNTASVLRLEGEAAATIRLVCDRCTRPFEAEKTVLLDTVLAAELEDEENDEMVLLDKGGLDLSELAMTAFVLSMEAKHLCSENCKGICPSCGTDLNETSCQCKPMADPRFAALAQLLEQSNQEE